MIRKLIAAALSIVLIIGSFMIAINLIKNKRKPKPTFNKIVKTVFVENVTNKTIPLVIISSGTLEAKDKIELFSEVQGVLEKNNKEFKQGTSFKKGETIIKINSDEFFANLQAQKSNLFNSITAIMPDIRLDFANEYQKWNTYLQHFNVQKTTPKLPDFTSEKEKFFISGRGILTAYYNVKNLEAKLKKYTLKAPFNGILTEALVNPGTLIRPGQKLGEFINPTTYEIGVSVKSEYQNLLQVNKHVKLQNLNKTKFWNGKVVRINGKVDTQTQTVNVYIQVSGKGLKEGQYLEAELQVKNETDAFEVSRNLLVDKNKLYVVKDSVLDLITVQPVFENPNYFVVKGLPNNTKLLSKPVPGAHAGMLVKIYKDHN